MATVFRPSAEIAGIPEGRGYALIGYYACPKAAMVGVIRVRDNRPSHSWECHGGGDELLVVLSGRFRMTLNHAQAPEQVCELEAGDAILIPRGVAHSAQLLTPEIDILFVTPEEGTETWVGSPRNSAAHLPEL